MLTDYSDIRSRLGIPAWFDEHGVPQYCEFRPINLASIYASEAVLFLVGCQVCGKGFIVAMSGMFPAVSDVIKKQHFKLWRPTKRELRQCLDEQRAPGRTPVLEQAADRRLETGPQA